MQAMTGILYDVQLGSMVYPRSQSPSVTITRIGSFSQTWPMHICLPKVGGLKQHASVQWTTHQRLARTAGHVPSKTACVPVQVSACKNFHRASMSTVARA